MTKYKNIILVLTVFCAKNPIKPNCQNVNWIARLYCAFSFLYRIYLMGLRTVSYDLELTKNIATSENLRFSSMEFQNKHFCPLNRLRIKTDNSRQKGAQGNLY